jgi:UDP-N-acetylmuramoyl-tripeptide--D-alanyl-D-alanine ligase
MMDVATVLAATNARVLRVAGDEQLNPGSLSPADLRTAIAEVRIDSRSVTPGSLFIALRGDRADGHDYVGDALRSGALGCIVSRVPGPSLPAGSSRPPQRNLRPPGQFLFVVPDPLLALQALARYWRRRHALEVIGITGSIGKTTTKEIVAAVLAYKWPVLKSEANFNTEIGIPLTLLRLAPQHRAVVLEMGMYAPGDIGLLARTAEPRIGVVTNVAPIHLERMQTLERIARAKSELVAALPPTGIAILNGDDPWTRAMAGTSGVASVLLIGRAGDCHYRATEVTAQGLDSLALTIEAEGRRVPLRTRVPGAHTVHAFLGGVAIGRAMGMTWQEIQEAIEEVRLDTRQRVLRGLESMLIIDDSYNAAPLSMNAALELLRVAPGTKIAVLGDMLELGPQEEAAHRQVGERAAEVADWLIVRGRRSSWIAEGATRRGFPPNRIVRVRSNADAVETVRSIARPGADPGESIGDRTMTGAKAVSVKPEPDVEWSVLVKGSRGMRMEEVVQGLRGDT